VAEQPDRCIVNAAHMDFCLSDDWRTMLEELVLPPALDGVDLGADVLEIGPGPGFTTDVLRGRTARLTAVEIDPLLFEPLAERLSGTNVDVVLGDATALDLPTDRFSAAASFNMLHHVPTDELQDRIFSELRRVLRPGGTLVAVDGVDSEGTRLFHEGDTYHPIDMASLPTRLGAAGFTDVSLRAYDLGWICTATAA
jgi:SAM-dependent methyltransferase